MKSRGLSFRDLIRDLRSELEERIKKAPHISNLHYRFKRIDEKTGVRKDIKKNIVMGVKTGKAYESEVKIAKEIIEGGIELNGEYFIGDKA
jgi:hypothetical protein